MMHINLCLFDLFGYKLSLYKKVFGHLKRNADASFLNRLLSQ